MNNLTDLDPVLVEQIRQDERDQLARLIDENAETMASFASDKLAAVRLVALCIRIGVQERPPSP